MPRQVKLIALYMVCVYIALLVIIHVVKQEVEEEATVTSQPVKSD